MKKELFIFFSILFSLFSCSQKTFNDTQFKYEVDDGTVIVSNRQSRYKIEPFRSDIVKTTFLPNNNEEPEVNEYFVVLEKEQDAAFTIKEFENKLQLKTAEITVSAVFLQNSREIFVVEQCYCFGHYGALDHGTDGGQIIRF